MQQVARNLINSSFVTSPAGGIGSCVVELMNLLNTHGALVRRMITMHPETTMAY